MSNIFQISNQTAKEYLLKNSSYTNVELPSYFSFGDSLNQINGEISILDRDHIKRAKNSFDVNFHLYSNKNGKYAWRKLELINPFLYVSLVNHLTIDAHRSELCVLMNQEFDNIDCLSLPLVIEGDGTEQKKSQIKQWKNKIESESIKLGLSYEYLFHTDISNCYGSFYTHSISWAIHTKEEAKERRGYSDLRGNYVDHHIQAMSNGQTNGIPQGSLLMDIVAEIILKYSDKLINQALGDIDDDYRILRFRDDYRIFTKGQNVGEAILKIINEVLIGLGLGTNPHKTILSQDVILSSLKEDKIKSMQMTENETIRGELLAIYLLGKEYPNSGSVVGKLSNVFDNMEKMVANNGVSDEKIIEYISILVNIGIENPRAFSKVARIISMLFSGKESEYKLEILLKIQNKINLLPNHGWLEVRLQRIAFQEQDSTIFHGKLCQLLGDETIQLFNNERIDTQLNLSYIDRENLLSYDAIISEDEILTFSY